MPLSEKKHNINPSDQTNPTPADNLHPATPDHLAAAALTDSPNLIPAQTQTPPLPNREEFHHHLRQQARGVIRTLLEEIMRQELDLLIGCAWGEQSQQRSGYRNGYYERDLVTSEGLIEDLKVPRDREGRFQTQVFERYQRHEPHIQEGITKMYVAGVSTHKVAEVTETLLGTTPSASTVSRLNQTLEQQFQAWRERPLKPHYRFLYLDGVYYDIRHQDQVDRTVLLTALAVDLNGNKEVLSFLASAEETKDGWLNLLTEVRKRGALKFDLILSDGQDGLLAAVQELFPTTPRQRCLAHKQRNVLASIPKRVKSEVSTELSGIWNQPNKESALTQLASFKAKYQKTYPEAIKSLCEEEDKLLTFYDFPSNVHRFIRTTNAIESMFSNVRDRTDHLDSFTTESSCVALVWATLQGIKFMRLPI